MGSVTGYRSAARIRMQRIEMTALYRFTQSIPLKYRGWVFGLAGCAVGALLTLGTGILPLRFGS